MGCCGCSDKATCIVAAVFTFLQGVIWTALAVVAVLTYNCSISIPSDTTDPAYYFILVYFYQSCQGGLPSIISQFTTPSNYPDLDLQIPRWPNNTKPAVERTYGISVSYIVLSVGWIITSLLLIIAVSSRKQGGGSQCMRYTWIFVTAATLILDLVATILYAIDISNTITILQLLTFLGVENMDGWTEELAPNIPDVVTAVPSIIMTLISARFIVIWVINLTFFIFVCIATHKYGKRNRYKDSPPPDTELRNDNDRGIPRIGSSNFYDSPSPTPEYDRIQNRPNYLQKLSAQDLVDGDSKLIRPQHVQGLIPDPYSNRSSMDENRPERRVVSYPTVIRNQMPWSYFQKSDNVKVPRQPSMENRPPVPPPDYDYTIPRLKKDGENYPERTPSDVSTRVRPSILKPPPVQPRQNRQSDVMY